MPAVYYKSLLRLDDASPRQLREAVCWFDSRQQATDFIRDNLINEEDDSGRFAPALWEGKLRVVYIDKDKSTYFLCLTNGLYHFYRVKEDG